MIEFFKSLIPYVYLFIFGAFVFIIYNIIYFKSIVLKENKVKFINKVFQFVSFIFMFILPVFILIFYFYIFYDTPVRYSELLIIVLAVLIIVFSLTIKTLQALIRNFNLLQNSVKMSFDSHLKGNELMSSLTLGFQKLSNEIIELKKAISNKNNSSKKEI